MRCFIVRWFHLTHVRAEALRTLHHQLVQKEHSSSSGHSANLLRQHLPQLVPSEPHRVTDLPFLSGHHGMATKFRGMYANEHMEGTTLHMLVSEFLLGTTKVIPLMCRLHRIRSRDSQCGTFALTLLNAHDKQTLTKETCVHPSKCNIRHHERLQRNTRRRK